MQTKRAKHIVDILPGIGLLLLMSYQVTGEAGHEWTGIFPARSSSWHKYCIFCVP